MGAAKTLEEEVVGLLARKHLTVTTAESCTGGLIAGTLINAAGASDVLNEGYVTYSNEAKERLVHVSHETLERFGAVSAQTAREMAEGAARAAGADAALSATGIAGPGGGVVFAPTPRDYTIRLNKKEKRLALKSALTSRVQENKFIVLDELKFDEIKTKKMQAVLDALNVSKALVVLNDNDANVMMSARNIANVQTALTNTINVYDILKYNTVIVTKAAVATIEEVYA